MGFEKVVEELDSKKKFLVVQTSPSMRVSIGEEFGYKPGKIVTGKLVGVLKELGFDAVFDTCTGADIVTMEETYEFLERKKKGGKLPIMTSCCPGFVSYIEHTHPEYVDNLCSCRSPQEVMGALIKTYFAQKKKLKPEDIYVVSVMPCIIKKAEAMRPELRVEGRRNVDKVLTTVELAGLLKQRGLDLKKAKESKFDSLLGESTGSANIFGATGGVLETVLRLAAKITGKTVGIIEFREVRGLEGIKEAEVRIGKEKIKVAVINGLRYASQLLNDAERVKEFGIIECMACFGGCVGGAGQPRTTLDIIEKRKDALYRIDKGKKKRIASENPSVKKLYKDFLGKPGSAKAKKLLHTTYHKFFE